MQREVAGPPALKPDRRVHEIDGLRGWAALMVVAFHFIWETFGIAHPAITTGLYKWFLDGPLAVYVFFVLSGDALASTVFARHTLVAWQHVVAKRYLRLATPIFISTMLIYAVMQIGWTFNVEAARLIHREDWLGSFLAFKTDLPSALAYTAVGVFGWLGTPIYNAFLWSISIEWTGSVLVLLSAPVLRSIKYPECFMAMIALMAFYTTDYIGMFAVGMLLSQLRQRGFFDFARANPFWQALSMIAIVLTYVVDFKRQSYPMPSPNSWLGQAEIGWRDHYFSISAPLIVIAAYTNRHIVQFLSGSVSQFLGRISYSLYIIQIIVLCSFLSLLIVSFPRCATDTGFALLLSAIAITACVGAAWILSKVEFQALRTLSRITDRLMVQNRCLPAPDRTGE